MDFFAPLRQKCYIHPATVKAYLDRALPELLWRPVSASREAQNGLSDDEEAVMMILEESSKAATERKVA